MLEEEDPPGRATLARHRKEACRGGGGVEGNRTPDLLIANEALYQLSYDPAVQAAENAQTPPACQAHAAVLHATRPGDTVRFHPQGPPGPHRTPGDTRPLVTALYSILQTVLQFYIYAVIAAAILSTLVSFGVVDSRNRLVWTIGDFLYRITEPLLRPIRNLLPNMGGLDLSPWVLILLLGVTQRVLLPRIFAAIVFGNYRDLLF